MYFRWKPNSSHISRPYAASLLPHGAPLRSPSLFCIKLFFGPFSLMLHPDGFLSWALPMSPNWNASTERLVAPSPAASRPPLSHFFSPRLLHLPDESPWLTSLFFLISGLFVSQPPFLFQVWPDFEWNQDSTDRPGELLRPLTRSCFLLHLLGRLFLLAFLFLRGICLSWPWIPPFPLHAPALIPSLTPTLTLSPPHNLVLWTDGSVPFPFGNSGSGALANCFLCATEATLSFSAGPVCWSLRHSARSLLVSKASASLPLLFSSPPI